MKITQKSLYFILLICFSRAINAQYIQVNDNGHVSQYMERVQALFLADFLTLLETNFEIIGTFGSYDLTSFDEENSDRLILLAHLK